MPEMSTLMSRLEALDPILVGLGFVALLLLILIFRRPKDQVTPLREALAAREVDLREAQNRASRAEALAEERNVEIERMDDDLAILRGKLDEEAARALTSAGRISGLEAELRAAEMQAVTMATRTKEIIEEFRSQITERDGQIRDLRDKLDTAAVERQTLTGNINRLEAELKAQGEAANEKIDILTRVRADMEAKFGELAREALKVQGEAFSLANIERLTATLTPLKEHVGHFERELKAVHQATVEDRAALKAEIRHLTQRSEAISKEATALTRALKSDQQKQGAWGEMILSNILERSGLREGEEYETQAHRTGAEGERLRPDVVVRIPGGKSLVIDSKVSLVAYTETVNAETEVEAVIARKRHVTSLRAHINGLSAKGYQAAEASTVDYVILFIPIEGALSEALREDGALTEYALERHITIATPTTLMMALRTVAHVWAVERRNRNAEEIAKRAGLLYDKVASFVGSLEGVGLRLRQAQESYDTAIGQLSRGSGNLLWQAETLKTLGAKTSKSISVEFDDTETDRLEQDGAFPGADVHAP
jgi:DNA recombination protein RmuC